jgi:cytochrome c oxidase assembly protein subunit 15
VLRLLRAPGYAGMGLMIGGLLALQVSLGISNVLFSLPLAVAVAHNTGAALLLSSLVVLNYRMRRR